MEQSGGQFVEQCTHLVDLSRYLIGEITEVSAYRTGGFMPEVPNFNVEDAMRTLAVTLAANESARERNGAPVAL